MVAEQKDVTVTCFHCGQLCEDKFQLGEKTFCCFGCKSVYEILAANDLCEYYTLDKDAGVSLKKKSDDTFEYLDDEQIRKKLLKFDSGNFARVTFATPSIHCVSCIWLLENLRRLNPGIIKAEVIFGKKEITIDFNPAEVKLSELASLLATLGYPPSINLATEGKRSKYVNRSLVYKLAVAGFGFGNVMLFSFPEYLGLDQSEKALMRTFSLLNLVISTPVFFYSAKDYFTSTWQSFKVRVINIDVPIAAGLLALFMRSTYDILTATGPGYLDSFTGLVFFLLIGRWFQGKTYESLSFDRDFRSYFPLAVNRLEDEQWKPVIIYNLRRGDMVRIRNMEVVPADSLLQSETGYFDYSFVTGEARPVKASKGDFIFAGGRLVGQPVIVEVEKETSQSHLTSLWNNNAFKKVNESRYQKIIDRAARRFTWIVMVIAFATAMFWSYYKPSEMWLVLTSVLMVACPCALALAAPFTYGSMLRVFGKYKLYLKNADVIERMAAIDAVVFDKTGTVTNGNRPEVTWIGEISDDELSYVRLLTSASTHPLSAIVSKSIGVPAFKVMSYFKEVPGKGIQAMINGKFLQIGSANFVNADTPQDAASAYVFVSIDDVVKGYFTIKTMARDNIKTMLDRLGKKCVALLSGDNDADKPNMQRLFSSSVQLLFNQNPHDKLSFVANLQREGKSVLMVGDGLNDSGAFKQSDVALAVSDDNSVFTPASDGIVQGDKLVLLDKFLRLAKSSSTILWSAFSISFFYNAVALTFAVTGNLTPLVAAILMPVSSVSVVGFSTLAVNIIAKRTLKE